MRIELDLLAVEVASRDYREPMLGKSTTAALGKLISVG